MAQIRNGSTPLTATSYSVVAWITGLGLATRHYNDTRANKETLFCDRFTSTLPS